MSANDRQLWGR